MASSQCEARTYVNAHTLAEAAALEIVAIAQASIAARGRFTIALAGGNTPRRTYELLATTHRDAIDWTRTDVVFGDERFVAHDDARSNYRMAHEALLSRVPIPVERIHPVPIDAPSPDAAAEQYETTLHRLLGEPTTESGGADPVTGAVASVDVALLGVGPDGHTASLFPGSSALEERARWVRATDAPASLQPAVPRVTTTFPFLDAARAVIFLVAGRDKRVVVGEILEDAPAARRYPAAMIEPRGRVLWLLESSAAPDATHNA